MPSSDIGILYDIINWEEKELVRQLRLRGSEPSLIDAKSVVLPLDSSSFETFPKLVLERCVSHYRGQSIAAILHSHGVHVINPVELLNLCANKLLTSQLLAASGIPTPKTAVAFSPKSALNAIETVGYPCVMKPIVGSWGREVVLIRDREEAESFVELKSQIPGTMQSIYYVQELIKRPNRDIRASIVGTEIVASVYRYSAPGAWRTSLALGGRIEPCKLTKELEDILERTSSAVGEGLLGVDLMEREDGSGLIVHEINGTMEFKGTQRGTQLSIAGKIADYLLRIEKDGAEHGGPSIRV